MLQRKLEKKHIGAGVKNKLITNTMQTTQKHEAQSITEANGEVREPLCLQTCGLSGDLIDRLGKS